MMRLCKKLPRLGWPKKPKSKKGSKKKSPKFISKYPPLRVYDSF